MNWEKLQEMQKALDESIIKQKDLGMTAEELFKKTAIALTVELAEVANCDEFFKHWKDNKGKVETKRFYSIPRTQREGVENRKCLLTSKTMISCTRLKRHIICR